MLLRTPQGACRPICDVRGNVLALLDENGHIAESCRYDGFGTPRLFDSSGSELPAPCSALGNPFGFACKRYDATTALCHFGVRWYDPALGRFISPDPLGFVDGPNRYAYCAGDPVNSVDPWGLADVRLPHDGSAIGHFVGESGNSLFVLDGVVVAARYPHGGTIPWLWGRRLQVRAYGGTRGERIAARVTLDVARGTRADQRRANREMRRLLAEKGVGWQRVRPRNFHWNHAGENVLEYVEAEPHRLVSHSGQASLARAHGPMVRVVGRLVGVGLLLASPGDLFGGSIELGEAEIGSQELRQYLADGRHAGQACAHDGGVRQRLLVGQPRGTHSASGGDGETAPGPTGRLRRCNWYRGRATVRAGRCRRLVAERVWQKVAARCGEARSEYEP